jgi:hypothetical protein
MVTPDRATYEAMVANARHDDVPIERFIALHLRRCAEARGYPVARNTPAKIGFLDGSISS